MDQGRFLNAGILDVLSISRHSEKTLAFGYLNTVI
jgi:hypothetical protein